MIKGQFLLTIPRTWLEGQTTGAGVTPPIDLIPPTGSLEPTVLHSPHPETSILCTLLTVTRTNFSRQLVSTHRMPFRICGSRRDHRPFNIKHCPWESKREAVSTESGAWQYWEKTYKHNNCIIRETNKYTGYPQKVWERLESSVGLTEGISL